jgi:hypothetical protein
MRQGLLLVTVVGLGSLLWVTGCSSSVVEKRSAKPRLMERIKQEAITGEVMDVGKNYVTVRESNGRTSKVRIDESTKTDIVHPGDQVKAYIDDAGHVTTLRRLEK